ncbi:tri-BON domain-containing protein [Rhizocola hellebori]|uniref:Tri-BON domain-containing protein n=1 Tax=Rhizocola hellebori TaxID=1392758 RepID=A0A8J3VHV9_9ACTN|nr:BON domain-containing protein [Rhizocola hellebori]GIH07824.1 tri-BON domain-containing protein [Rhizocola hellebori]
MVGLMMQTTHQTDQDIQANVTEELLYDPSCQGGHLKVTSEGGAVKLSGEVASLREKLAAKRSAMRVRGVKAISDEMTVRSPGVSGDATDADITQAARHMLDWSIDVPASSVKVAVRDHKATLSGHVAWGYQRDAAHKAMTNLRGITAVKNEIVLDQTAAATPAKAAIMAALQRNAQLEPQSINVDVNGHDLVLRGNVRTFAEYRQAEHTAWNAAGVTSVQNNLVVTS